MQNVLMMLKSACVARAECGKQEMIFWQKLYEAVEVYLLSQKLPIEPIPTNSKIHEHKPVSKNAYMSSKIAAEYLGVCDATLAKWRCVGGGPRFVKIGRSVRYRPQDLEAFVNEKTYPHTSAYGRK